MNEKTTTNITTWKKPEQGRSQEVTFITRQHFCLLEYKISCTKMKNKMN